MGLLNIMNTMKGLNEKQLYSVKNRVRDIQLMIDAFEHPSDLLIIPDGDKYSIYLGDALMQNVEGSFKEANNALQSVARRIKARREEQRYRIDALKIELTYYLSLIEK